MVKTYKFGDIELNGEATYDLCYKSGDFSYVFTDMALVNTNKQFLSGDDGKVVVEMAWIEHKPHREYWLDHITLGDFVPLHKWPAVVALVLALVGLVALLS